MSALRVLASAVALCGVSFALDPWQDWTLPLDERVADLVSRLTQSEKFNQVWSISPAIARLNISAYNWRSNCLHGWAESGGNWLKNETWTVFPTPLAMGATWNTELVRTAGRITGDEGRALHNLGVQRNRGASTEARGLNCFAPNVNIFRDPRWGRNLEVFSEDPHHIGEMGVAYALGLQTSDDPKYIKVAACGKHYAVHDGPENVPQDRLEFVANVTEHDMLDSYLPQFRTLVQRANVAQIMCAYSSVNRSDYAPDCANTYLLQDALRTRFGFQGMVISDNGALEFEVSSHHYYKDYVTAAAASLNAGTDNDLGGDAVYANNLAAALSQGLTTQATLDRAVARNLRLRFQLGEWDPQYLVPFASWGADHLDTPDHKAVNVQVARESLVLLTNDGTLPLAPAPGAVVAVIGPSANDTGSLLGNYQGVPSTVVTVLGGLAAAAAGWSVKFASGCGPTGVACTDSKAFEAALTVAAGADAIVFVGGIDTSLAKEGNDWSTNGACDGQTVEVNGLPGCQLRLLQLVRAANPTKPVVVVTLSGTAMWQPWEEAHANATLLALYPGSLGGVAVAEALLGTTNPGGRLPFTVPVNITGLPSLADVAMSGGGAGHPGRTYRYTTYPVAHPFGFGLSYTTFAYTNLRRSAAQIRAGDALQLTVTLTNTGARDGDEVVQVYAIPPANTGGGAYPVPLWTLRAFTRVRVPVGASTNVTLVVADFTVVDAAGEAPPALGIWALTVGGQQPGQSGPGHSCGQAPLTTTVTVSAAPLGDAAVTE